MARGVRLSNPNRQAPQKIHDTREGDFITIVYAILIFILMILVHEIGHFCAAKACGVKVNEFAFGLGPALLKKQFGETTYAIRALPFGGQCVMEGEDEDSDNARAFTNAAKWKRIVILLAGVVMNFLLGLVIFTILMAPAKQVALPVVDSLMDKFTGGGEHGIHPGDQILSIDGYRIYLPGDIATALSRDEDNIYNVVVKRGGERVKLSSLRIAPQPYEENGKTVQYYGFRYKIVDTDALMILKLAYFYSLNSVRLVFDGLRMVLTGGAKLNDLTGPVGITAAMSTVAKTSMPTFWYLVALITINLAVMNLLPLPALDGGRILFVLYEAIFRRPMNRKVEAIMIASVLVLLIGLMLVITFNDIWRLVT